MTMVWICCTIVTRLLLVSGYDERTEEDGCRMDWQTVVRCRIVFPSSILIVERGTSDAT